jgi:hypothetical protein
VTLSHGNRSSRYFRISILAAHGEWSASSSRGTLRRSVARNQRPQSLQPYLRRSETKTMSRSHPLRRLILSDSEWQSGHTRRRCAGRGLFSAITIVSFRGFRRCEIDRQDRAETLAEDLENRFSGEVVDTITAVSNPFRQFTASSARSLPLIGDICARRVHCPC